jgi:hypothetical protein
MRCVESVDKIHGVVTMGNNWKFLKYEPGIAYIDKPEYYILTVRLNEQ